MSKFAVMRGYLVSMPFRVAEIERETAKMFFFAKKDTTYWRLSKDSPKIVAVFETREAAEKAIKEACDRYDARIADADEKAKLAAREVATLRMERIASIQMKAQS